MSATVEIITPHENNPVAEFFSSSNTPETDEQINGKPCTRFAIAAGDSLRDALVPSEFARKLERERDEAREDLKITQEAWVKAKAERVEALRERDEARAKYATEATDHMLAVNKLCNERDEAREDAAKLADRLSGLELSTTQALARLEQERNQARKPAAWIPVARALPDDDMTVLIHLADGEVWTGFLEAGHWRFVSGDRIETPVLHWRPFPDAPKPSK